MLADVSGPTKMRAMKTIEGWRGPACARPSAAGAVRLGDVVRGGRGALRRASRPGDPLRHQHLAVPAGQPGGDAGRAAEGMPLNGTPIPPYGELVRAITEYTGCSADQVLVGCGADEVLDMVAKTSSMTVAVSCTWSGSASSSRPERHERRGSAAAAPAACPEPAAAGACCRRSACGSVPSLSRPRRPPPVGTTRLP